MADIQKIVEELSQLTVLEAAELATALEEAWGVSAAAAVAVAAPAGGGDAPAAEEKDEFDVVLTEVPADKKIAVLKIVRTITGLGLKVGDRRLFSRYCDSPFFYDTGGQGHGRVGAGHDQGGRAQGRGRGHPEADRGGRRQGRAQVGRCAFSRLTYVPLAVVTTSRRWRRPAIESHITRFPGPRGGPRGGRRRACKRQRPSGRPSGGRWTRRHRQRGIL